MTPPERQPDSMLASWAGLVVGLYALTLAVGAFPLAMLLLGEEGAKAIELYRWWPFWVWCGLMVVDQAALLALPVRAARGRPVPRRTLKTAIGAAGFAMAALTGTTIASVWVAIGGNDAFDSGLLICGGIVLASWAVWGFVFWRYAASVDAEESLTVITRWLLRGSVLELLVAVPSHVIVRRREDCCAPGLTSMGIATGLAVMLMSFGPGVVFLYLRRARDLRPSSAR